MKVDRLSVDVGSGKFSFVAKKNVAPHSQRRNIEREIFDRLPFGGLSYVTKSDGVGRLSCASCLYCYYCKVIVEKIVKKMMRNLI
jgi:hypothetical protein